MLFQRSPFWLFPFTICIAADDPRLAAIPASGFISCTFCLSLPARFACPPYVTAMKSARWCERRFSSFGQSWNSHLSAAQSFWFVFWQPWDWILLHEDKPAGSLLIERWKLATWGNWGKPSASVQGNLKRFDRSVQDWNCNPLIVIFRDWHELLKRGSHFSSCALMAVYFDKYLSSIHFEGGSEGVRASGRKHYVIST